MYQTKQRIYTYLDKTQKSMICTFLRSYCKNIVSYGFSDVDEEISVEKILEHFISEQNYYLEQNASRFPFLAEYLGDEEFLSETREYIAACKRYYDYKKSQAPILQKQKEYEKKKRKFLQEVKMSKEPPTKKQLYYYERLCKKYSIEKRDIEQMSKLDMRNEIERIIDEHSGNSIDINVGRD